MYISEKSLRKYLKKYIKQTKKDLKRSHKRLKTHLKQKLYENLFFDVLSVVEDQHTLDILQVLKEDMIDNGVLKKILPEEIDRFEKPCNDSKRFKVPLSL